MVGTSGRTALRRVPLVPSTLSRPLLMCGTTWISDGITICAWPAMTSAIAGPPPLYGTCTTSIPAWIMNSAQARCCRLPTPAEA